jgi:hypothetical protein
MEGLKRFFTKYRSASLLTYSLTFSAEKVPAALPFLAMK